MISPTQRPWLPHEHPGWKDYTLLFLQKLKRDVLLRKPFISHNSEMAELFAKTTFRLRKNANRWPCILLIHFSITPVFSFAGHIYPAGPVSKVPSPMRLKQRPEPYR